MQVRSYGTIEIIDSVVSNNRHFAIQINGPRFTTSGGGLFVDGSAGGDIFVINTTMVGNVAENGRGGGIYNSSTQLRVTNSTRSCNCRHSSGEKRRLHRDCPWSGWRHRHWFGRGV